MKTLALLCLVALSASSCVYGPKTEHKSPLNALNGEHYATSGCAHPDALVVPIMKRKEKATELSGRVLLKGGIEQRPLAWSQLILKTTQRSLRTLNTDAAGSFRLSEPLENGDYELELQHPNYRGQLRFQVSSYEVKDLIVVAEPK